jgi:hypothetical protein
MLELKKLKKILKKFNSCLEALKNIGTSTAIINMYCNGKRKTVKAYIWRYESINL